MRAQHTLALNRSGDPTNDDNVRRIENYANGYKDHVILVDHGSLPTLGDYQVGTILRVADTVYLRGSAAWIALN